ncbi:neurogenic locus protein delta [Drosophila persimilis]|uniref:Delta-like protein n=1 Tax=Drosophila pseudoobscura pseudoobscura TaxID=46245 RepID=A0A6I8US47_DROPS|nr:neurogenic locus protein delta [Drosophila pseudoobscura]XP_026850370.1 neurogenic locus protein delta [Drosophila persimilis]
MHWIKCLLTAFICFTVIVQVHSSGNFELRLKYFSNEHGRDNEGRCCSGETDAATGKCLGTCKTRFRVCLKHYQATIDTTSQCTYGDVVTPILGENSVNLTDVQRFQNKGFSNPIQFPFQFSWPGTFSLIVEAWHDTNNSANTRVNNLLIQRLLVQQVLEVSSDWKTNKSESQYTSLEYDFRVTCDSNYYGSGCAKFCRTRDDSFGHSKCSETGEIICLSGWQGDYCHIPKCAKGCEHGHCDKPNQCVCQLGWKGPLCNECVLEPNCIHGTCNKPWTCICNEGWGGLYCNQDLNYCTNHRPCKNGGTCFNTGEGLYTCKCAPGFSGDDCETEIYSCDAGVNPCQNGGTCVDEQTKGGYKCMCANGWSGRMCEDKVLTCADKPCHQGTCRNVRAGLGSKGQGFQCDCPGGYSGPTCELQLDNCRPNPCQNGGSCQPNGKCICPSGFTGSKCETNVDDCLGHKCENGGICIDLVNQYRCQCVPGFHGSHCSSKLDLCLIRPCANGGTCLNLKNDFQCTCRAGFTGKDCSIDIDECISGPCHNGGTCMNRVNNFECVCANGFRGKQCDEESYDSVTFGAHHYGATTQARADGLTNAQVVLIAVFSVAMPLVAVIAACVVFCMKRKRKRAQEKDDAEARKQNEQNAVATMHHNGSAVGVGLTGGGLGVKTGSNSGLTFDNGNPNIIKNTWDKSVNNICASAAAAAAAADECLMYGGALSNYVAQADNNANSEFCGVGQIAPLQRAKSQKQLNTDPTLMHRSASAAQAAAAAAAAAAAGGASGTAKDYSSGGGGAVAEGKRISVLGEGSYCSQRWPSLAAAGVAGACSSQMMAAASATGSGAGTTQRTVVCGTPHM